MISLLLWRLFPTLSPQGAFSLVTEAWYSPASNQPGGEEVHALFPPLEGDTSV